MKKRQTQIKPLPLQPKSTVALVAPSFTFSKEKFENGIVTLKTKYNLKPEFRDDIFAVEGYFSGTSERRVNELYEALTNPKYDAVLAVRGGYGCSRIYPKLIEKLKKVKNLKPKIVMGYSDITILLNALHQDLGWTTFHGPVLVSKLFQPNHQDSLEQQTFTTSLFSNQALGKITHTDMKSHAKGTASGVLVGGCLSLVCSALGTPYEVHTKNKILFLEDVGERPYRIDRMLTQLIHSGTLDDVRGIIFGQMTDCEPSKDRTDTFAHPDVWTAIASAIDPFVKAKKIPVIFNFPGGHGSPQCTFPIGANVEIVSTNKLCEVHFLDSGCDTR